MHRPTFMTSTMRKTVFMIATLGGLAACALDTGSDDATDRKKYRDAGAQPVVDSGGGTSTPDAGGGGSSSGGTVSCYTEGAPSNTCTLPTHCCFFNYSSQHNGSCETSSCSWGTIDCDGPEDCASGQHCCSTQLRDSNDEPIGYRLACQSNACGSQPLHEELCHSSATCSNGGSCVTAYGNNNDLPRSLYICR
jgi:hypothetical protein